MDMIQNLFSLKGKTALVTGARTGIGQAISVGLASAGAHVLLLGHRDNLDETKAKIDEAGGSCETVLVDLGEVPQIREKSSRCSKSTVSTSWSTTRVLFTVNRQSITTNRNGCVSSM